jgi:hypothetical protein
MISAMATRENEFELKAGRTKRDHIPRLQSVRAAVRKATQRPRQSGPKPKQPSVRAHFAKSSKSRTRPVSAAGRRVVVKMRYAANAGAKGAPLRSHVAYLEREGASRAKSPAVIEEQKAQDPTRSIDYLSRDGVASQASYSFFDRANVGVDAKAVTAGWADDPRHFRMIVSAEDGEALGDLKPFIRELMAGLEAKLGTKLEWLAVNHHDTDNPHTHVLIRGRRPDGKELFIPSRLISHGIREQAQAIVARVLGPRAELDLARERFNDIDRKAVTSLDRELLAAAERGLITPARPDLATRLERLEGWGLAERRMSGWRLADGLTARLTSIAEHDAVERAVASVRKGSEPQLLLEADRSAPVLGELVHLGPSDEFGDKWLAVIETGAGELRYARFEKADDLAILTGAQPGGIVEIAPNEPSVRPSDEAVARVAARTGGVYSPKAHVELEPNVDQRILAANVRRLEVMRRMGLIERSPDGVFAVGDNHLSTALAFEERLVKRAPFSAQVVSYWSLGEQIEALGPTQLDRVLAGEARSPAGEGLIARDFQQALQQRRLFLIEQGWMGSDQQTLSQQALRRMAALELSVQAEKLSEELGIPILTHTAHRVSGVYARRVDLAQGRMALIVGERQANLVPWRPALERFGGRTVEGVMRGQGLSWNLARGLGREIGLPPM